MHPSCCTATLHGRKAVLIPAAFGPKGLALRLIGWMGGYRSARDPREPITALPLCVHYSDQCNHGRLSGESLIQMDNNDGSHQLPVCTMLR